MKYLYLLHAALAAILLTIAPAATIDLADTTGANKKSIRESLNITERRPEDYGAKGDGITNDYPAFASMMSAAADGDTIVFGPKTYRLTTTFVINKSVRVRGDHVSALYGRRIVGAGNNGSDVIPTVAPYLSGSVLLIDTPGINGVEIPVSGKSVSLEDFGIKFGNGHRFNNTGHGVYACPPAATTPQFSGELDNGIAGGKIKRVYVYGHDGNHYALSLTNAFLIDVAEVQGWGGGGLELYAATRGWYGNATYTQTYFMSFLAGTAHGYYLHGHPSAPGGTSGTIYTQWTRPQAFFWTTMATLEGAANPYAIPNTAVQWLWKADDRTWWIDVSGADLEADILGYGLTNMALIKSGANWSDAQVAGRAPTTFSSNLQQYYASYSGGRAHNLSLNNTGSGVGTAAGIGFSIGGEATADKYPAWIGGSYLDAGGMGLAFGVGGGGASANNIGSEALRITATKVATFAETVYMPRLVITAIPSFANDAAADAALASGQTYRLTGNRTIFVKP